MPSVIEGVDIMEDIDHLAELINKTSAECVEINLACPNSAHNLIYLDIDLSIEICRRLRSRMNPDKKLIVKVSYYPNQNDLRRLVHGIRDLVDGITSINTIGMKVVDMNHQSSFGPNRSQAGISGGIIRPYAVNQMENLIQIRKELALEDRLGLIAVGGVSKPEHIHKFLSMGRNIIVQAATGVWENPNLAINYKTLIREQ